ncbi:Late embryogenesis abundant hydroxyproline-rich glycoprotein [Quillaja saponaria]|uniref:Late embryogenesis abundant hydroxyproline-rich glycoprotein n=1 Tax=Quillaja saponaria TaxID=32244 RepID=A0AAD7KYE6_QUISA|nr:Late embryogenesis abundant hydroxyproline-rich glycoprotein [Quillaja saponaria]
MQDSSRPVTGYPAHPYPQPQHNGGYPPPGTAYPYPAQPPHQQYYNPNPNSYYNNRRLIRTILAFIIGLVIIISVTLFVIWLVLRPRYPEFRVDSLSLNNFSDNSSQSISGTWQVGFVVFNANKKMRATYDALDSSIYYKSEYLSQAAIPPFKQNTREETPLNVTFSAINSFVHDWVVNDINGDRSHGSVNFNLNIRANVWFRSGGWRTRTRLLRVLCRDVAVGVSSNSTSGKLLGGGRKCNVW